MSSLPLPLAVFLAGLLSFLSPCVLPLVPGYVSLISGASADQLQSSDPKLSRTVLLNSVMFILGFSAVFIALGAVATGIGQFMNIYRRQLMQVAGVVIIIFGLHLIGVFKIKALLADKRLHEVKGSGTALGAFVIGFLSDGLATVVLQTSANVDCFCSNRVYVKLDVPLASTATFTP